ncbi:ATP-binding protein [Luteimonas composti]|uniref:histidine kinase n=1 Tax=Luteimonas composti TaxID=398257 RepID=A0ABT6MND0_9GAMM|nr:ATP-binding protein [Luteimonas composti]MDH7452102.1 ATP-binding protein [Luteimonas composti]
MSGHDDDRHQQPPPAPAAGSIDWAFRTTENAVILLDGDRRPLNINASARALAARALPGQDIGALLDLLPDEAWTQSRASGRWAGEVATPADVILEIVVRNGLGQGDGVDLNLVTFVDVSARNARQAELQQRHDELQAAHRRLAGTQEQLLQSEKMASIGLLAAGVAHEINNPIGYVHSNLGTLQEYMGALLSLIECQDEALQADDPAAARGNVREQRDRLDIDFIVGDLPKLMAESREGIERVTKIVQDLKEFSYVGRGEPMRPSDLHKGLESTLNIVWNDLKYKVRVEKHYGQLPLVECHLSEINQVLMCLLINAGQAIEHRGTIDITTGAEDGEAWISVADSGCGIPPESLPRIFDPFFTSKPIGRGTGLGLAIAYSIVSKHHGRIEVSSEVGVGSTFRLVLPVEQPRGTDAPVQ